MVGAVGLTAAAMSSAALADGAPTQGSPLAPPADPPKWTPYAEVGGGLGSGYTVGKVDIMAPLFQNLDSLLFVHVDAGIENQQHDFYSFGAGYRTRINPDWILGVYANYDSSETPYSHTFNQGQLGAELMSADWDVRVNGYLADSGFKAIANKYELYIHDTEIAILQGEEAAYSGFDGEVGYRIFSMPDTDVRVFAGGFMFNRGAFDATSMGRSFDTGYRTIEGPKARAEVTLYDLDAVALQSRLSFEAEIAHDDVRGTTGFVGAVLRIPLHAPDGPGAQALDELDRRMVDPERRQDNVLTRWHFAKPEPVVVYGQHFRSQPTNTLYYVDNTQGEGSYANPTTLSDATGRPGENAVIVITSKQGTVTGDGVMQAGQTMIGGGETFGVTGTESHAKFVHDFAPGTTNPTVAPAADGDNVITLADTTVVYGFSITGDFGNAIYGHNVDNVNIGKMTIDGEGSGYTGVYIKNDQPGTSNIYIYHTSVSDVAEDGIAIYSDLKTSGTLKESDVLVNDSVTNAGYGGIQIYSSAGGAPNAVINQYINIQNATVTNSGFDNIQIEESAGPGGVVTQNIVVDPTTTSGGYYGLALDARAYGGGQVGQYGTVTDFTSTDAIDNGVIVAGAAYAGGKVTQKFSMSGITVTGSTNTANSNGNGLFVYGYAYATGVTKQSVTVNGLTATGNAHDGVDVDALMFSDGGGAGTVEQYVSITNATINNDGYDGIDVIGRARGTGYVGQTVKLTDSEIAGNYYDGVFGFAYADFGAKVIQKLNVSNDLVAFNGLDGVVFSAVSRGYQYGNKIYGSFVGQYASLSNDIIADNFKDGVHLYRFAGYGTYVTGHPCTTSGGGCATIAQTVDIADSAIYGNGRDGIYVGTVEYRDGAVYAQAGRPAYTPTLLVTGSTIDDNGSDGLEIENNILSHSYLYQYVVAVNSHFDHNGGYGIYAGTLGYGGSFVRQVMTLYGHNGGHTTVSNNYLGGVTMAAYMNGATSLSSAMMEELSINDSDIEGNKGNGVELFQYTKDTFESSQQLYLIGDTISQNTGNGARAVAYGIGDYFDIQIVRAIGTLFADNGSLGLDIVQKDVSVNGSQDVAAVGSSFVDNGAGGFSQAQYLYHTYRGVQSSTVAFNYFTGPGNAISITSLAYGVGGLGNNNYDLTRQVVEFNALNNIGGDGIDISISSTAAKTAPSDVYDSTAIAYNQLNNIGGNGVSVDLTATGYYKTSEAASISTASYFGTKAVYVFENKIYHTGGNGIGVELSASYDGTIYNRNPTNAYVGIAIYGNTVGSAGSDGIQVSMNALAGLIGSYVDIGAHGGNSVSNAGGYGIALTTSNRYGVIALGNVLSATPTLGAAIENNSVYHSGLGGIAVNNYELKGVTEVYSYIGHNEVTRSQTYAGINIVDKGYGDLLLDLEKIYNNASDSNVKAGIGVYAYGDKGVFQGDYIGSNKAGGNLYGILGIDNGAANQGITVYSLGNAVAGNTNPYHFIDNGGAQSVN